MPPNKVLTRARAHTHTQKLMQLFYVLNFCDHVTLKFEEFLAIVPRLQTKATSRKDSTDIIYPIRSTAGTVITLILQP